MTACAAYAVIFGIMKITLLQRDIIWADPEANIRRNAQVFRENAGSDLYVFPEMFSTGFCTGPEGVAERLPSVTLEWMKEQASAYGCAIAGSIAIEEDGKYFNRFCFVFPDGKCVSYDKRHLFTCGGEHLKFTRGEERVVVTFGGLRILPEICYDLRFPVWSRNRGDYDMIIYVANWPVQRAYAWKQLLRARAIENQCYVAGVNRCGSDPCNRYEGGTVFLDPSGKAVAGCPDGVESSVTVEVDTDLLDEARRSFPVLDDADSFVLGG